MSLIRVRRDRKKDWIDTRKGKSPRSLLAIFILVSLVIWFLSTRF
jgi:hypothetical protein